MIAGVIQKKHAGVKIYLCGQASGDFPGFVQFLAEQGSDGISFNPDALLKGIRNIKKTESKFLVRTV
jgi:pyruvate,water dikinase